MSKKQIKQLENQGYEFSGQYYRHDEKELAKRHAAEHRAEGKRARVVKVEGQRSMGYSIYIKEK